MWSFDSDRPTTELAAAGAADDISGTINELEDSVSFPVEEGEARLGWFIDFTVTTGIVELSSILPAGWVDSMS